MASLFNDQGSKSKPSQPILVRTSTSISFSFYDPGITGVTDLRLTGSNSTLTCPTFVIAVVALLNLLGTLLTEILTNFLGYVGLNKPTIDVRKENSLSKLRVSTIQLL